MPRFLGLLLLAACGSGGGFPDARPIDSPPPKGTFSLAWTVSDTGSNPITCDQIGGQSVTAVAHNEAFDGATPEVFVCSTLMGQSPGLEPGTYDFKFTLDSSTGTLATAPDQNQVVIASNQDTPLTPIAFALDATGAMNLHLATGRATNCGVAPSGGGISSMTLTLTHNGDLSCEPLTLQIAAGATRPAAMYVINCGMPSVAGCIENDQAITATGVKADGYQIHVKGFEGAASCWSNNDSIVVPPLGQTLDRTLNLGFSSATPGCM